MKLGVIILSLFVLAATILIQFIPHSATVATCGDIVQEISQEDLLKSSVAFVLEREIEMEEWICFEAI